MTETNKQMTAYEKMQAKAMEIEQAEIEFNKLHRKAKYFKIKKLQPLQREFNVLAEAWKTEMKQKTGMG
jgi:hypothetical protein